MAASLGCSRTGGAEGASVCNGVGDSGEAAMAASGPFARQRYRPQKHFAQSLCQDARKLDQFCIYRLGASDDFLERRSRDLVPLIADQYPGLAIAQ